MKTSILSLVSAVMFALTLGFAADAKAQVSISFGGSSIQIRDPFDNGGQSYGKRYRPTNPVIDDQQSGSFIYNPSTGNFELKRQRDTTHLSALDRNRNVVDPGSMRAISSRSFDAQGNTIETTVTSWTSYGVPHSNTTKRVIRQAGGISVIDEQNVRRSVGPTRGAQAAPQHDDSIPGFDD